MGFKQIILWLWRCSQHEKQPISQQDWVHVRKVWEDDSTASSSQVITSHAASLSLPASSLRMCCDVCILSTWPGAALHASFGSCMFSVAIAPATFFSKHQSIMLKSCVMHKAPLSHSSHACAKSVTHDCLPCQHIMIPLLINSRHKLQRLTLLAR